jgi:hypothetical protein
LEREFSAEQKKYLKFPKAGRGRKFNGSRKMALGSLILSSLPGSRQNLSGNDKIVH